MARNSLRTVGIAGTVASAVVLASACSSGTESPSEPSATSPATTATTSAAPPTAPAGVGVSPGGVTTAVSAPAESTEDDYFQACRAARTWMEQQGGDPRAQVEPYLGTVQHAESVGPGTFDKRWSELTPGQQSAVIVAVEAAADALCG
ncbi:lipoprotein LpqV [Mycobacterium sp. ITM-2016-00317]|uniref:lipoprotein LpqV n=1 Tax=Mycobacterium sp. ITM-2016-00317 TaxID=2099694 RepID=UPI00287F4ADF|nr:lipoprotein LpqV [Mycobacterium sp. ITM-2016-00317]WNG86435.1 lipoprotein LpqV [Mycobacterium sp. ITM-2016-00317]